jgi:hypothetical protein
VEGFEIVCCVISSVNLFSTAAINWTSEDEFPNLTRYLRTSEDEFPNLAGYLRTTPLFPYLRNVKFFPNLTGYLRTSEDEFPNLAGYLRTTPLS